MADTSLKFSDFPVAERREHLPCRGGMRSPKVPPERCEGLYGRVVRELKLSRNTRCFLAESPLGTVFVKEYRSDGFLRRARRLFCPSRAVRTLRVTRALEELVPVPELLLAISRRRWLAVEQRIVTPAYAQPLTAYDHITSLAGGRLEDFAGNVAAMVNAIHRGGVFHGDLKMQNILCRLGEDGGMTLGVFDFDGSSIGRSPVTGARRHREWARVISSFLRACRAGNVEVDPERVKLTFRQAAGDLDARELDRQLARFAGKEAAKKRKTGR